ncbi:MAG: putative Fe-S cluster assembly protein SufT [Verrucomicrobiaceae bacterium]|nr:MAG: putative Fe-S cluster assembly protein SufT [Verrucomicrobiaceae bacterium]
MQQTEIELAREVEAIQIPSGDTIVLPAGIRVIITQSLGGSYTVATEHGLARISAKNADALGIEKNDGHGGHGAVPLEGEELNAAVWEQLKGVFDPEIPVNIVDLGLVYDCEVSEEEGQKVVDVKMTLTAPGCGMGPTIAADAQSRIMQLPGIANARVELVWEPAWNQAMISEEGRMQLGMV